MRTPVIVIAVLIGLVGLVWVGQGSGLIAGSAMSGNPLWLVVGIVLLVIATGIVIRESRLAPQGLTLRPTNPSGRSHADGRGHGADDGSSDAGSRR